MSSRPLVPLRWWEHWMLQLLLRSPRIERIIVQQPVPEPYEGQPVDFVTELEALYHGPSADEEEQG